MLKWHVKTGQTLIRSGPNHSFWVILTHFGSFWPHFIRNPSSKRVFDPLKWLKMGQKWAKNGSKTAHFLVIFWSKSGPKSDPFLGHFLDTLFSSNPALKCVFLPFWGPPVSATLLSWNHDFGTPQVGFKDGCSIVWDFWGIWGETCFDTMIPKNSHSRTALLEPHLRCSQIMVSAQ